jgi:hypothetical protein
MGIGKNKLKTLQEIDRYTAKRISDLEAEISRLDKMEQKDLFELKGNKAKRKELIALREFMEK